MDRDKILTLSALRWINLSLLVLYPVAWAAPLMRAGLLPLFGLSEISVLTGIRALWESDRLLALVVILFALVAPYVKTLGLALVQFGVMGRSALPVLSIISKLAMADIFLIALYITIAKGVGIGHLETAWGLYLFTACILTSLGLSMTEARVTRD
ncbi:paraquat-inducible protein A [Marivita sp.]|uniref:paraquat-inducible protein A n=1 Tax=Marivita sp. TaxID=2003365 RepID=UPI0025BAADFF|nr:paraquat-inducible protein A [Marivita sp.]